MQVSPINNSQIGFRASLKDIRGAVNRVSCPYDQAFFYKLCERFDVVESEMFKNNIPEFIFNLKKESKIPETLKNVSITKKKTLEVFDKDNLYKCIIHNIFSKYEIFEPCQIKLTAKKD